MTDDILDALGERLAGLEAAKSVAPTNGTTALSIVPAGSKATVAAPAQDDAAPYRGQLITTPLADLRRRIAAAPDPGWLIEGLWPADSYGVFAAESKAGKSWAVFDLAVAVAAGRTRWLGVGPHTGDARRVLVFVGEGAARTSVRRLDAVADFHNVDPDDLDIHLCHLPPKLGDAEGLRELESTILELKPGLVIIDPLYLSAGGADGSSLYSMGDLLVGVQTICQAHDAALIIVHHWNQTGSGSGKSRISGTGPEEWGRVVASMAVKQRRNDGNASVVDLEIEFVGGEINDTTLRFTRRVEALATDASVVSTPMSYSVTESATAEDDAEARATELRALILARVTEHPWELLPTNLTDRNHPAHIDAHKDRVSSEINKLKAAGDLTTHEYRRQEQRQKRHYLGISDRSAHRPAGYPDPPTDDGSR